MKRPTIDTTLNSQTGRARGEVASQRPPSKRPSGSKGATRGRLKTDAVSYFEAGDTNQGQRGSPNTSRNVSPSQTTGPIQRLLGNRSQSRPVPKKAEKQSGSAHFERARSGAPPMLERGLIGEFGAAAQEDIELAQHLVDNHYQEPERVKAFLLAHPRNIELLIEACDDQGEPELAPIGNIFGEADRDTKDAIISSEAFRTNDALFEDIGTQCIQGDDETFGLLAFHSNREMVERLMRVGMEPWEETVGMFIIHATHDNPRKLRAILPAWVASGGDPTSILTQVEDLSPEAIALVKQLGGSPNRALEALTSERYHDTARPDRQKTSVLMTLAPLLRYGARLTREHFDGYVAMHRDEQETFKTNHGFGRVLRIFETYDAIPKDNLSLRGTGIGRAKNSFRMGELFDEARSLAGRKNKALPGK